MAQIRRRRTISDHSASDQRSRGTNQSPIRFDMTGLASHLRWHRSVADGKGHESQEFDVLNFCATTDHVPDGRIRPVRTRICGDAVCSTMCTHTFIFRHDRYFHTCRLFCGVACNRKVDLTSAFGLTTLPSAYWDYLPNSYITKFM